MFEDFKPKFKQIMNYEKKMLQEHGYDWCGRCRSVKTLDHFYTSEEISCRECVKEKGSEYRARHYERRAERRRELRAGRNQRRKERYHALSPDEKRIYNEKGYERRRKGNYYKRYCEKYPEKCAAASKKSTARQKGKSRKHTKGYQTSLAKAKLKRKTDINFMAQCKIYHCLYRVKNQTRCDYLNAVGVSSTSEFVQIMADKCGEPNWMFEGYDIDHIWQVNWFEFNEKTLGFSLKLLNHHSNLRPLTKGENRRRSKTDFGPIKFEDVPKYWPFLKNEIKDKMLVYFGIQGHRPIFDWVYYV